ncbi:M23 family metallopeptidase [uncultured Pseudokineococcus sp.]|uniref:M23 family metallopeptidase n=1 Tax=uncultured Pseudokineococcus sp. TaxID=1642928 RepID=UPI00262CBFCE|nr:M23 family metallopeptidase [uncultured Pseudokineococcus sp.]
MSAATTRTARRPRRGLSRLAAVAAGLVVAMAVSLTPAQAETGAMVVPTSGRVTGVVGAYCTSGRAHGGIDIAAPTGTPVRAADSGVVSIAGRRADSASYGIFIRIHHGTRYRTIYAHLSKLAVKPGQTVKEGQVIGYVGNTGRSYGAHLHFEVRLDNVRQSGINTSFRCRTNVTAGNRIQWGFPYLAR